MSDKYINPSGLAHYDEKIKEVIDGKDKSKGDTLYYDEDKSELQLKSGENVLSAVTIIDEITVDDVMSETSTNPVQNKIIKEYVDSKEVPVSEKENNAIIKEADGLYVDALSGEDGKSAYDIACDNGFEGSEEEWLESLNGDDGRSILSVTKDSNDNIEITFSDNTTQNIGKLSVDIQGDFLTANGFGNLRYYNGKFQYYDTNSSTWVDTSVSPSNVLVVQMIPNPMKKIIGIYDMDLRVNKLKFEEPSDTIMKNSAGDDEVVCVVESVVIRRKLGSMPVDETDGDLVVKIERKDFGKYKKEWFIDGTITPNLGDTYCYKAFPMSTTGFYGKSATNETSILCKDYHLYGFKLDQNESDPAKMITYLEDCNNANFKSAYMNYTSDTFDYGDWEDAWFIKYLKPCMLKYDGTVDYELDKNDYTKKLDGTNSDIANDSYEGNAMVGIPKVYWKIVDNGDNTANVYISDVKLDDNYVCWSHIDNNGNEIDYCYMPIYMGSYINGRLRSLSGIAPMHSQSTSTEITYAKANNQGTDIIWYIELFNDRMLVNLLLLLIGKSTDTQSAFGNGHYTGGYSANNLIASGTMNNKGLFYGTNGTATGVKVFGIEHWWGNQWRRIGGWINYSGIQKIKLTYDQSDGSSVEGYNFDGNGYIEISSSTLSGTSGGYIDKMLFSENGLIPITVNGSSTTYYCDGTWYNNSQINYANAGGCSTNDKGVGALSSALCHTADNGFWYIGASLSCKPLATT